MKANEAPEKIYLYPSRLEKGKIIGRWFMTRYNQDSVEYIRTDAFIEKACEWLEGMFGFLNENGNNFNSERFIKNFKNAMEG